MANDGYGLSGVEKRLDEFDRGWLHAQLVWIDDATGQQQCVEIPGVSTDYFLKAAVNAVRKHRGEPELDAMQ